MFLKLIGLFFILTIILFVSIDPCRSDGFITANDMSKINSPYIRQRLQTILARAESPKRINMAVKDFSMSDPLLNRRPGLFRLK